MPIFAAFHGVVPTPDRAAQVAAVPYDVVNTEEAAALAAGNPLSFLHISRPEIDLPPGTDPHGEAVYEQSRAALARIRREAPLLTDAEKHLYLYRQQMGDHVQTGVVGCAASAEYLSGVIKKHEKTRKDKEDDRTRQVMAIHSHTGPAFFTYRGDPAIDAIVEAGCREQPYFSFTAPDGIVHTLWRLDPAASLKLQAAFAKVPCFYIADGHHRSAAAARVAQECAPHNPNHNGTEEYNFFLAVAFPAAQLRILPYNRVVKSLNGRDPEAFLRAVAEKFSVEPCADGKAAEKGDFRMYLGGKWYRLRAKLDEAALDVIGKLDVSILQNELLAPILGIDDPRTSPMIDFVGGMRGTGELEKRVDSGECKVAFSLYPTTVDQLMAIADAGAIMPPKSTWFEPKLRDGIVCHDF